MSVGERLKAAVVGCGGAGVYNHIAWYATHPGVELVALVDADAERAAVVAAQWGGRPYHDLDTMLERERPRLVSIATPVHLHVAHTIRCLTAGCDVLCEKPMAPTPADCRRMLEAAAASGRMLGIALDKRFSEEFRLARKLIRDGEIGEPLFVRVHWVATVEWSGFRTKRYTAAACSRMSVPTSWTSFPGPSTPSCGQCRARCSSSIPTSRSGRARGGHAAHRLRAAGAGGNQLDRAVRL